MEIKQIQKILQHHFPNADSINIDGSSCKLTINIIDASFEGENRLQRQRIVNNLFKDAIASGELHAITVVAKTPQENQA
jgi:acid stress-induced BolA-like protein IbaG/YrbA